MAENPEGAIGHIDEFRKPDGTVDYEQIGSKVIDGPTGFIYPDIEAWREHVSPISGTKPTDPEYLIQTTTPNYAEISAKALERGAAKA